MFCDLPFTGLVLLLGPPYSGKSTFARLAFPHDAVIATDEIRALLTGDRDRLESTDAAFKILIDIVKGRLEHGLLTVVDSTGSRLDLVERLLIAAEDTQSNVSAIHINADAADCNSRVDARSQHSIPLARIEEIAILATEVAEKLKMTGVPVRSLEQVMPFRAAGHRIFLAMPVTENIGHSGFRPDKRRFYTSIHDALQFGGFRVASAAVNEEYGTVSLEPQVFTRYDLDSIQAADCLVVATPSTLSPDVYLEIGLAHGAGKPVGMILPARGRFTAMMRGLVDLGVVHRKEFDEDHQLPYLTLELALNMIKSP